MDRSLSEGSIAEEVHRVVGPLANENLAYYRDREMDLLGTIIEALRRAGRATLAEAALAVCSPIALEKLARADWQLHEALRPYSRENGSLDWARFERDTVSSQRKLVNALYGGAAYAN